MTRQSPHINTVSLDGIQADTNASGVEANLSNDASFRNHADSWFSLLTDVEVDEVLSLLLFPVPVLSEEARRVGFPIDSCAAVSGHSIGDFSAHIQG